MQPLSNKTMHMILIWLVVASGLSIILFEYLLDGLPYMISFFSRSIFWLSAISYFAFRLYGKINR